ncbi:MAG: hypothetical protein M1828_007060 [Chrysothrix sp. TS-e1954]|nr:MAG: hypothetical protein M1828_007060 [Chrysothrix sp. TS-e1954]
MSSIRKPTNDERDNGTLRAEPVFALSQQLVNAVSVFANHHDPPKAVRNGDDAFPFPPCGNFTLEEASIDDMQHAMSAGRLNATQLLECYTDRVYQTQEYINSVLQLNPDAPHIAATRDRERQDGHVRGPLHGIPFMVKDNIASRDKMQTTAGSWALQGSVVPRDAFVLSKLRDAGAVLMGKSTLSEWADMRSNNYSEGYSGRGGQCRSAYNFTVNPGGSSSGSAVGVAANVFAFALGTETDGSVINPAERNAIVGIKPTVGRTSRNGVIPESTHQDTVGTFGRTVRDATYAFDAIWGPDSRDPASTSQPLQRGGYASLLTNKQALRTATFGIPWDSFWVYTDMEQRAKLLSFLSLLESAGAKVVNHTEITDFKTLVSPNGWDWDYGTTRGYKNESEYTYVAVDFYNNIAEYLSELENTDVRTLQDIVDYNYANDGTEGGKPYPDGISAFYSGQDGLLASLATGGVTNKTYWQALGFCQNKTRNGIDDALAHNHAAHGLSALLVPPDVGQSYQIAAQAGYPMLTLPAAMHSESGMPYGLALMQTAWAEDKLVKWGSAIENLVSSQGKKDGLGRALPKWQGYLRRNIPVINA